MSAGRRHVLAGLLAIAAGCATTRVAGAGAFQVQCNVPEALVFIDDVFVGRAAEWAGEGRYIKAGGHRVELRHAGHYSHYSDVEVPEGGAVLLKAQLHPLLD